MRAILLHPGHRLLLLVLAAILLTCLAVALVLHGFALSRETGLGMWVWWGSAGGALAGAGALGIGARRMVVGAVSSLPPAPRPTERASSEKPWTVRRAWRSPTQQSRAVWDRRLFFGGVLFAVLGSAIASGKILPAMAGGTLPDGNTWIPVVLIVAGCALSLRETRPLARMCTFGPVSLTLDTYPGRLGKAVAARFETGRPALDQLRGDVRVQLSCYARTVEELVGSEDGPTREPTMQSMRKLLWRDETVVSPRTQADGLQIPAAFQLPADQPPSTPEPSAERILWEMRAIAAAPGVDFDVAFEIPVFAPEDSPGDAAAPDLSTAESARRASRQEWGDAGSRVQAERQGGGVVRVRFGAGGNPVMTGVLGVPGLVLGAMAYFMVGSILYALLGLVLGVVALGCLVGAVRNQFQTTAVAVEQGEVAITTSLFGWSSTETLSTAEVAEVAVAASGTVGRSTIYALQFIRRDAAQEEAPTLSLADQDTSAPDASDVITVTSNLRDKERADWIAAEMQEAIERQAAFVY